MAQFNTPTVNGAIGSNEYGSHVNGQNQQTTSTTQNWFVTWDNSNLYVAVTSANINEAAVIYIDGNPISPVNGGSNANGNLTGFNYDNTNFASLPFRADFVAYFKNGYREYRNANGSGGWSAQTSGFGSFATGAGDVRELAIPWSAITGGGRPASFNFFAYVTSGGGYVYGQVPQGNVGMSIGTSATYNRYYNVGDTSDGTTTKPFGNDSTVEANNIEWNGLRHDSFNPYYRSPFGSVTTGSNVTLRFRTALSDVTNVYARVYTYNSATQSTSGPVDVPMSFLENRIENGINYDIYTANLTAPANPSILYYKFRVIDGADEDYYSDAYNNEHDNLGQGGDGTATDTEPFPAYQITVYSAAFTTPTWLQNSAVYQIFPDRFRNGDVTNDWCRAGATTGCPSLYGAPTSSNIVKTTWNEAMVDPRATANNNAYGSQFYGGDLKGVEDKLDYIKSLGFDTIYMTPIFAARSNHGYDADNYLQIAPQLGGDAAFTSLKNAADARGMKIILDGVWNHVSQDSFYMDYYNRYPTQGGCESFASPYRNWFTWNATATTVPCVTTHYNGWFGFTGLPELTERNEVKDYIYRTPTTNVTQYWFDRGASGWRFDVADNISHNWWLDYRPFAKTYKSDAPLIGEIWYDSSMYLLGDQLDSVMNYRFRKNVLGFARSVDWEDNDNSGTNKIVGLTPSQFNRAMLSIREDYPLPAQLAMLNLLDSHDTNRALYTLTVVGDSGLTEAKQRLKLAATFQFTYLGAPMVYYGDEAGINSPSVANNGSGLPEDDPYNRAPYPWSDETGSTAVYGPTDNSLISYYTILGSLRKQNAALRTGSFETLLMGDITASTTDNNTFAFARQSGANKVVVILNNGSTSNTAVIPVGSYFTDGTTLTDALGNSSFTDGNSFAQHVVTGGNVTVTLAARTAAILVPFAPTAATAVIAGRITLPNGTGLGRVNIDVQNINTGEIYKAQTDASGYYRVEGRLTGNQYLVTPSRRLYSFAPKTELFTLLEDRENLNFTAQRR